LLLGSQGGGVFHRRTIPRIKHGCHVHGLQPLLKPSARERSLCEPSWTLLPSPRWTDSDCSDRFPLHLHPFLVEQDYVSAHILNLPEHFFHRPDGVLAFTLAPLFCREVPSESTVA